MEKTKLSQLVGLSLLLSVAATSHATTLNTSPNADGNAVIDTGNVSDTAISAVNAVAAEVVAAQGQAMAVRDEVTQVALSEVGEITSGTGEIIAVGDGLVDVVANVEALDIALGEQVTLLDDLAPEQQVDGVIDTVVMTVGDSVSQADGIAGTANGLVGQVIGTAGDYTNITLEVGANVLTAVDVSLTGAAADAVDSTVADITGDVGGLTGGVGGLTGGVGGLTGGVDGLTGVVGSLTGGAGGLTGGVDGLTGVVGGLTGGVEGLAGATVADAVGTADSLTSSNDPVGDTVSLVGGVLGGTL